MSHFTRTPVFNCSLSARKIQTLLLSTIPQRLPPPQECTTRTSAAEWMGCHDLLSFTGCGLIGVLYWLSIIPVNVEGSLAGRQPSWLLFHQKIDKQKIAPRRSILIAKVLPKLLPPQARSQQFQLKSLKSAVVWTQATSWSHRLLQGGEEDRLCLQAISELQRHNAFPYWQSTRSLFIPSSKQNGESAVRCSNSSNARGVGRFAQEQANQWRNVKTNCKH